MNIPNYYWSFHPEEWWAWHNIMLNRMSEKMNRMNRKKSKSGRKKSKRKT